MQFLLEHATDLFIEVLHLRLSFMDENFSTRLPVAPFFVYLNHPLPAFNFMSSPFLLPLFFAAIFELVGFFL